MTTLDNLITNTNATLETQNKKLANTNPQIMTENVIPDPIISQENLQNKTINNISIPSPNANVAKNKTPKLNIQENKEIKYEQNDEKLQIEELNDSAIETIFLFDDSRKKIKKKFEARNEWECIIEDESIEKNNKNTIEKSIHSSQSLRKGNIIYITPDDKSQQRDHKVSEKFN